MAIEEKKNKVVRVKGRAETKAAAISDGLTKIQKTILKEHPDQVILRIEPKSVEVLSAKEVCYTEKFLFFFMPRERISYEVELQVTTEMLMIQAEALAFEKSSEHEATSIRIPFTSKRI
ncbi:uncharacterized protein (TIGR03578 family) [Enterococcus sp. PF1-24]|uniref:DUF4312 family protein n=1 Tax=unclassified Enterococcus TaxID=2608891 RepID=UPI002474CD30|nr:MULTISPECIES: DUF4312 family protein [unclassified Enterococcus]MDH6363215.1 uncharacterized protein (TIGR03578 family) [Enterococcus sp. PFB1-1]MDH6400484.1 uncharacterized protein (TIGR03578 family) [Enterococcus sp. PF1-24]